MTIRRNPLTMRREVLLGDASDTSPYVTAPPETGISTGTFIRNMSALMQVIDRQS